MPLAANLTLKDRYVHSLIETVTGTYGIPYSSFSSRVSPSVNTLEREELEVVLLVEPAAFENSYWQSSPSRERKSVDRELDVRVFFSSCVRFVVENVDVTVANLQKIYVAGNDSALKVQIEPDAAVVEDVLLAEKDRHFHGYGHRIVNEHEALQCLVTFLIVECCRQDEGCHARGAIFLSSHRRMQVCGKLGRAVLRGLENLMRKSSL